MRTVSEFQFPGTTALHTAAYDSTKTTIGRLIDAANGSTPIQKWVGPKGLNVLSVPDVTPTYSFMMPHVYKWSDDEYWIFGADNTAAALTRRIGLFRYIRSTNTTTYVGAILLNFSGLTGNKTSTGLRVVVTTHTSGTVTTSGSSTTVTGSGTQFTTDRIAAGARIGFGSTDPTAITTWYDISTISSDTSIVISSAVNLASPTSYVIEEIRVVYVFTNATATNGGLALVKGLNYGTFVANTTIAEAVSTDNVRAIYFFEDAATTNMTVPRGVSLESTRSPTSHFVYVLNADTTSAPRIYKWDIRAALTVASGQTTSGFVYRTGQQTVVSGTVPTQGGNSECATLRHGAAAGDESVFFVTTNRIIRCPIASITNGSTTYQADAMQEILPGNNSTFMQLGSFLSVQYSSKLDRLFYAYTAAPFRIGITQYDSTNTTKTERFLGVDSQRLYNLAKDSDYPNVFLGRAVPVFIDISDGIMFGLAQSTVNGIGTLSVYPLITDYVYCESSVTADRNCVITPAIQTPNAVSLYRVYYDYQRFSGTGSSAELPTEGLKIWYRTQGILDNSGEWSALPETNLLSGSSPGENGIQFKIGFRTIGDNCLPCRLYNIGVVYEDDSQISNYQPSVVNSSISSLRFAWKQVTTFGGTIPNLEIILNNSDTNGLLLSDTSAAPSGGTWEYSTNGGSSWNAWSAAADAVGNYIRYTANSLPNSVSVRATLRRA